MYKINYNLLLSILIAPSSLSFIQTSLKKMNLNTLFLFLLVIAAYLNLYLTFKRKKPQENKTKLPISSKEWRDKVDDENFKSWLSNREKLKDKRKNN